jgi:hypothetical protein
MPHEPGLSQKAKWIDQVVAPISRASERIGWTDLRYANRCDAWRAAGRSADYVPLGPGGIHRAVVEALKELEALPDWSGGFLVAEKHYASFADFYAKELAGIWAQWGELIATWQRRLAEQPQPEITDRCNDWPSREQWAHQRRTPYVDLFDDLPVSGALADYATPTEIESIIAQLRALYAEAGRELRAAKHAMGPLAQQAGENKSAYLRGTS